MKRLVIASFILAVAAFILYNLLFADRRSRLSVETAEESALVSFNESINAVRTTSTFTDRLLVKEGWISFEVTDALKTRDAVVDLVREFEGYVASEDQSRYEKRTFQQTVRIPADSIDEFLESKHISVEDVTEGFVDEKSRLATKRKLEARYQEILKQANTVEEILEIERQLKVVREEIESTEGRLNYLSNRAAFGVLKVEFHEPGGRTAGFGYTVKTALSNGWTGLLTVITVIVTVWPITIAIAIGTWIYFRRKKPVKPVAI
jgi:hypothetical protein